MQQHIDIISSGVAQQRNTQDSLIISSTFFERMEASQQKDILFHKKSVVSHKFI